MNRDDVREEGLWVTQRKTGKKLRIAVVGDLEPVVDRVLTRLTRKVPKPVSVQTDAGQRLSPGALRGRFEKAKKDAGVDFQFRA
jgi:hypothetical protein